LKQKERFRIAISDLNSHGEGVGRIDNMACFVPGALPGEIVLVEKAAVARKYIQGKLISRETDSPHRVTPFCAHFTFCGGCQLQHLAYQKQLDWKKSRVTESLKRIGGIETIVHPVIPMDNPCQYRNKAVFHINYDSETLQIGFYHKKTQNVVDIEQCLIQHPPIIETVTIFKKLLANKVAGASGKSSKSYPRGIKSATIRSSFFSGKTILNLEYSDPDHFKNLQSLGNALCGYQPLSAVFLHLRNNTKNNIIKLWGEPYLEENIGSYHCRISANSFFQVNPAQADQLFSQAAEYGGSSDTAIELYCGTGSLSLYLARRAKQVKAIDSNIEAINDARHNAAANQMRNITFFAIKAEEMPTILSGADKPGAIYLDPPRQGCSEAVLDAVVKSRHRKIVYISCNPSTLARDSAYLKNHDYILREAQPFDMFPHTSHVEVVALFKK